jgi:hypothetical protein
MLRPAEPKDAAAIGAIRVAAWQAAYRNFLPQCRNRPNGRGFLYYRQTSLPDAAQ